MYTQKRAVVCAEAQWNWKFEHICACDHDWPKLRHIYLNVGYTAVWQCLGQKVNIFVHWEDVTVQVINSIHMQYAYYVGNKVWRCSREATSARRSGRETNQSWDRWWFYTSMRKEMSLTSKLNTLLWIQLARHKMGARLWGSSQAFKQRSQTNGKPGKVESSPCILLSKISA